MITPEEIGEVATFSPLAPADRERLARAAADISLPAGEFAAHEGDERALFAILSGRIEAVKVVDGIERVVGERHPGDVFGEVPIVLGTGFPVGFRAAEPTRVMRIEPAAYHSLAASSTSTCASPRRTPARRPPDPSRYLNSMKLWPPMLPKMIWCSPASMISIQSEVSASVTPPAPPLVPALVVNL